MTRILKMNKNILVGLVVAAVTISLVASTTTIAVHPAKAEGDRISKSISDDDDDKQSKLEKSKGKGKGTGSSIDDPDKEKNKSKKTKKKNKQKDTGGSDDPDKEKNKTLFLPESLCRSTNCTALSTTVAEDSKSNFMA
jgi:hypothetical protein